VRLFEVIYMQRIYSPYDSKEMNHVKGDDIAGVISESTLMLVAACSG
jgi:hypothetical protein